MRASQVVVAAATLSLAGFAFAAPSPKTEHQQAKQEKPQVVMEVQQHLKDQGFNPGPADGRMGSQTKSALEKFQKEKGLPPTGRLDEETLAALNVTGEAAQAASVGSTGKGGSGGSSSKKGIVPPSGNPHP